jgi:type VI protein secretion system component VasF
MKAALILFVTLFLACQGCATAPQSTANTTSETSPESQAKTLTERMKTSLELDDAQTEKVLLINVVHFKILKRLRTSNENDKIAVTKQKYREEIKAVLSEIQYEKFLVEFDV